MSANEDRRKAFADKFNQLMAPVGKNTATFKTDAQLANAQTVQNSQLAVMSKALMAKSKADLKPAKAASSSKKGPTGITSNDVFAAKIKADNAEKTDHGLLAGIVNTAKEGFGEVMDSPVGRFLQRPLDIISRPAYAVDETMRRFAEGLSDDRSIFDVATDGHTWGGALAGISGHSKTGFGQVVQELVRGTDNGDGTYSAPKGIDAILPDFIPYAPAILGAAEKDSPNFAKWTKRALGITGDIVTDPTTYMSFGSTSTLKGVKGLGKVVEAASKESDNLIREVVTKATTEAAKGTALAGAKVATGLGIKSKKISAVDSIINSVADNTENLVRNIGGGAFKGHQVGTSAALQNAAQDIANQSAELFIKQTEAKATAFLRGADPNSMVRKWSPARLAKERADDPLFARWYDEASKLSPTDPDFAAKSSLIIKEAAAEQAHQIYSVSRDMLANSILKVPTLRVVGKDIAQFPLLGQGIDKLRFGKIAGLDKSLSDMWHSGFGKAFSHSSTWKGTTSLIESRSRSLGIAAFERDRQVLVEAIRKLKPSKEELKLIQHELSGITPPTHPIAKLIRDGYDQSFQQEILAGLRDVGEHAPDYAYVHIKKGSPEKIKEFAAKQKKAMEKNIPFDGIAEAKKLGLVPEENAAINYLYKLAKSNRDVTRARFIEDLAANYGINSPLNSTEMAKFNLVPVSDKLPGMKNALKNIPEGTTIYLDKDIAKTIDAHLKMTSGLLPLDEGSKGLIKALDYMTRKFKVWNTVYFPAYHIKNFMSDMFLGHLDGVTLRDYKAVTTLFHEKSSAVLKLGEGIEVPYNKLWEDFLDSAGSGFVRTELGGNAVGKGRVTDWIFAKAEQREDLGRFAHFYHAMKEEYPKELAKLKGSKTINSAGVVEKAYQRAIDASVFRVNKYKFDFQALTPFERNFMRRGIPFYTYMRKAVPTILESALLSPRYLSYANRAENGLGDGGMGMLLPQWMRDIGYSQIVGGDKPWGITNDLTPNATISGAKNTIMDPLVASNPLLQVLSEIHSGKDTFTGAKIDSPTDLITNHLRAVSTAKRFDDHKSPYSEQILQFFGIPARQVTGARQDSTIQSLKFQAEEKGKAVGKPLEKYGYHSGMSMRTDGVSFRIWDSEGNIVHEYKSFKDLEKGVNDLLDQLK